MRIFAILGVLLVIGCTSKPASVSVAETAKESISALEKALPPECQTDYIKNQLAVVATLVDTELKVCENEKDKLQLEKEKKDLVILVLAGIIFLYVGLKVFKKL